MYNKEKERILLHYGVVLQLFMQVVPLYDIQSCYIMLPYRFLIKDSLIFLDITLLAVWSLVYPVGDIQFMLKQVQWLISPCFCACSVGLCICEHAQSVSIDILAPVSMVIPPKSQIC